MDRRLKRVFVIVHHFTTFGLRHVFKTQVFQDFTNNL